MAAADVVGPQPRAVASSAFALWGGLATVVVADGSGLGAAVAEVRRIVDAFDVTCSSFRGDSELTSLNRCAGRPVVVSSLLFIAVQTALRAARLTDGAVDPTVGRALLADGVNPRISSGIVARVGGVPGYRTVRLDPGSSTVQVPSGVWLDLGATAKALAADMAAGAAAAAARCGVLVSLCGDIATAGRSPNGGWRIRVGDDHRNGDTPGQTVAIADGGLATSSVTVRRGPDGVSHHLIDPATGVSTSGPWRTVSVAAGSCVDANAASTAAIVLGAAAPIWLEHQWLPARLVATDSTVRYVGEWPTDGDEL
jgi:thiamine biosynthesis lipoprotein